MFHCRSERGEPVPILEVSSVREWSIGEEPRSTDTSNPIRIIERRILLRQGTRMFGKPAASVQAVLEEIDELDRLEELIDRSLAVKSWDELLAPVSSRRRNGRRKKRDHT